MANPPAAARYGKQPAAGTGSPAGEPHPQDIAAGSGPGGQRSSGRRFPLRPGPS